jgi:glycosyltransferase involved in cell wall biosynthesis
LTKYFLRHVASEIVCVADHSKKYLDAQKVDLSKLTVIHNGIADREIDKSKRSKLRKEWGVKENEILLGVASRLDPVKGLEYLIEALALIQEKTIRVKLVIIGTGTLDQRLKRQVDQLRLKEKVLFTGYRTDINQCLGAFDIFMLPSLAEYHSIAILEAMRAAKPIIATNVGGNTESVRKHKEALIVPPKDPSSLADAIERLSKDKELREQLGENARLRFLKEFTADIMVKKTAKWLVNCSKNTVIKNDKSR